MLIVTFLFTFRHLEKKVPDPHLRYGPNCVMRIYQRLRTFARASTSSVSKIFNMATEFSIAIVKLINRKLQFNFYRAYVIDLP